MWLVPIVLVALGAGVLGALGVTGQLPDSSESVGPSESPVGLEPSEPAGFDPDVGDLEAADRWFGYEPGPLDGFPNSTLLDLDSIDPADVRLMATQEHDAVTVWAAKSREEELCLLVTVGPDESGSTCGSREDFTRRGLGFGVGDFRVSWTGQSLTIERTSG